MNSAAKKHDAPAANWLMFLKWKTDNDITEIDLIDRPLDKQGFERLVNEIGLSIDEIKKRITEINSFPQLLELYYSAEITIVIWEDYKRNNHSVA